MVLEIQYSTCLVEQMSSCFGSLIVVIDLRTLFGFGYFLKTTPR